MIKTLKKKVIFTSMIAITILLVVLLGAVNVVNAWSNHQETENLLENSRKKLEKKNLDMVAANNVKVAGAGFGVDTNVLTLITAAGEKELPLMSKDAAADALLDAILAF